MIRKPSNKQIEYYFKWNLLSFEVVDYNCWIEREPFFDTKGGSLPIEGTPSFNAKGRSLKCTSYVG